VGSPPHFACADWLLTILLFWNTLEIAVYPFVFPAHLQEVLTRHPPDGSLAPFPGAGFFFRILLVS